jgi:FkbM family methyltransferase
MVWRLGRWFARAVPTGVRLPVLRGPLRGSWWLAGAAAGNGKGLAMLLCPTEAKEMEMVARLAPRGGVAFDLGANVGGYSVLLARYCARVFAFEPVPRNVRFLVQTLAANRLHNVTVVPCAVSDAVRLAAVTELENCSLPALDPAGTQPALTVSCDEFAERFGVQPGLLKIDVEGGEVAVLRGASRLLRTARPVVLLSTHGPELEAECRRLMRAAGYGEPRRLTFDLTNGGGTLLWPGRQAGHPRDARAGMAAATG